MTRNSCMTSVGGNCVVTLLSIQKRRKPDPQRRRVELCDAAIQLLAGVKPSSRAAIIEKVAGA